MNISPTIQTAFHVGFDARLTHYRQGGIAQYMLNLLRAYIGLAAEDRLHITADGHTLPVRFTVFHSRKEQRSPAAWLYEADDLPAPDPVLLATVLRFRPLWTPPHHRLEQVALPLELAWAGRGDGRMDVFHSSDFIPPFVRRQLPFRAYASVATIHDLAFLRFPHILTRDSSRYYGQVRRAVTSAERLIAVSNSTARDATILLGASKKGIRVVYEAAAPHYRQLDAAELALLAEGGARKLVARLTEATVKDGDPLLLFVSTIEPRKNLPTLLRALRLLLNDHSRQTDSARPLRERGAAVGTVSAPPRLVIVGNDGWLSDDVYRLVAELHLRDAVLFVKNASADELLWLYHRATLYALPSLYEGFGLTVLEAMRCGLPVVASNVAALPEVVGDAGVLLPAEDVSVWAATLKTLLADAEQRATMRAKGLVQAARFDWRTAAEETLAIYAEAATNVV